VANVTGAKAIELVAGLNDRQRFEGCRGAIKIDAGVGQRRELGTKLDGVECVHEIPRIDIRIVAQIGG